MTSRDGELFDPGTRDRIRQYLAPGTITAFVIVTLVMAAALGAGHREIPFLARWLGVCAPGDAPTECARLELDLLAGLLGLVVFGGLVTLAYRARRIPPTVTCESCGRRGWVMDLEPREGRCPRCAGFLFTYRITLGGGNPNGPMLRRVIEEHMEGSALVERFRATRDSMMDRYY